MEFHLTATTLLLMVVGAFVGMFSSVVGGGALVLIPLFVFLGAPLAGAIATLRLSALIQQGVTVAAFWKERSIEWKSALWVGLWCLPGSYVGAHIVLNINERLLSIIVAACMVGLLVGSFIINKKKVVKKRKPNKQRWKILAVTGLIMGVYGGFYGAGFSTVLMLVFSLVGGVSLLVSSGNSSVAALLMGVPASIVFLRAGVVHWDLFLPVTIGGVIGSWIGVEEAAHWGMRWVQTLLVLVVFGSVVKLIFYP